MTTWAFPTQRSSRTTDAGLIGRIGRNVRLTIPIAAAAGILLGIIATSWLPKNVALPASDWQDYAIMIDGSQRTSHLLLTDKDKIDVYIGHKVTIEGVVLPETTTTQTAVVVLPTSEQREYNVKVDNAGWPHFTHYYFRVFRDGRAVRSTVITNQLAGVVAECHEPECVGLSVIVVDNGRVLPMRRFSYPLPMRKQGFSFADLVR